MTATETMWWSRRFDASGIQPDIGPLALNRAAQEGSHPLVDLATQSRPASGRALTNDSSRLADMRVWLDEKRHRSPAWSGRPGTAGSGDRVGEQPPETLVASRGLASW